MKRILAVLTATVILIGALTACGGNEPTSSTPASNPPASSAPANSLPDESSETTTTATKATTSRTRPSLSTTSATTTAAPKKELLDELANTKYLLTQKKALTIGYIGGSITNGTGVADKADCWREKATAWLEQAYPDATITAINAAVGATGSYYGKNRIDFDLLDEKPDLVFIEFVVNDEIEKSTYKESSENMETMVRKCLAANPNMDIVFVYTTTVSLGGNSNTWTRAFDAVAEHYGLEVIDTGKALKNSGTALDELFVKTDKVHPNKAGYAIMADEVISRLTAMLADAGSPTALKAHSIPSLLNEGLNINTNAYDADALYTQNPHLELMTEKLPYGADKRVRLDPGDTFSFTFNGESVGIYWYAVDPSPISITCTLSDGRSYTRKLAMRYNSIIEPLFVGLDKSKEYTITVTYSGTEFLVIPFVFTTV